MDQVYEVGEEVLLTNLMGEVIDPPCPVRVINAAIGKGLLEYEVVIPQIQTVDTGRIANDVHVWAMAKWLVPAQIVIQEAPEYPFD